MSAAPTPVDIIQRQLEAYNRRDLESFLELFADDATVQDLGAHAPTLVGKAQIRARYQSLFAASPELHSHLVSRIAFGRAVVDLEYITGREGAAEPFEMLAIYEVEHGLIRRLHAVRKS